MATPPHTRPSKDKDAAAVLKRMADCPAFFERLVLDPFFSDFPNPFFTPIRMPGTSSCKCKNVPPGALASEAVVRTWSIQFLRLDRPDFYRLSFRAVHGDHWRLVSGHDSRKVCAYAKKRIEPFANRCHVQFRSSGITRSLTTKTKKSRKEKT
jgi:hypothetical protein